MSKQKKWTPLQRAELDPPSDKLIAEWLKHNPAVKTREEVLKAMAEHERGREYWINDLYQIEVADYEDGITQINIRRHDGDVIFRDWRHFQRIKNELLGPECEAIELYPAESRLVDTSNKYHLWGVRDPEFRFPIGMPKRDVRNEPGTTRGTRQRPMTDEQALAAVALMICTSPRFAAMTVDEALGECRANGLIPWPTEGEG